MPVVTVTEADLRKRFNSGQYWERVQSGELVAFVEANRHPSSPLAGEPVCTRSQLVHYYTKQLVKVAVVHQYLRKDGTLGLSGRPDPKKVCEDGTVYVLATKRA